MAACRPSSSWSRVAVDPPRDAAHGEAATNAALVLAKAARKPPMALAGELAAALEGKRRDRASLQSPRQGSST